MKKKLIVLITFLTIVLGNYAQTLGTSRLNDYLLIIKLDKQTKYLKSLITDLRTVIDSLIELDSIQEIKQEEQSYKLQELFLINKQQLNLVQTNCTLEKSLLKDKCNSKRWGIGFSFGYGLTYHSNDRYYVQGGTIQNQTQLKISPYFGLSLNYNFFKF